MGNHKLIIKTTGGKYNINKISRFVIKTHVDKKINQLTVSAKSKTVKYGDNDYFNIVLKNNYGYSVKHVLLKVNVYSGKKYKVYSLKTNSRGISKINTNGLSRGTHKLIILSADKYYKFSKVSKIIVNKSVVFGKIEPTKLVSLKFYSKSNEYYAKLSWISKSGVKYQILRKSNDSFGVIATIAANSNQMSFDDKINKNDSYIYTVREIIEKSKSNAILGPFDSDGLKVLSSPNVVVDFKNTMAKIHWSKVSGATKYFIYRKIGREENFNRIACVDGSELDYVDYYYKSADALSKIIKKGFLLIQVQMN